MKLQQIDRHGGKRRTHIGRFGIDEKSDARDEGWHASRQAERILERQRTRTGRIKHEADGIDTRAQRGIQVDSRE